MHTKSAAKIQKKIELCKYFGKKMSEKMQHRPILGDSPSLHRPFLRDLPSLHRPFLRAFHPLHRPYMGDISQQKRPSIESLFLVPRAGVEPARIAPLVFETSASTDSAIWANAFLLIVTYYEQKSSQKYCFFLTCANFLTKKMHFRSKKCTFQLICHLYL